MDDLKQIVATNIINLRSLGRLTQTELGEKINYSDKAVSRWERAEATPDARVLLQLSEIFGVTVDYLLHDHSNDKPVKIHKTRIEHKNIIWVAVLGVWTIAFIIFVINYLLGKISWIQFIYAIPTSLLVFLVLNSIWGNKKFNMHIIATFIFGVISSLYFSVLVFLRQNWWIIFTLEIPAYLICYLCFRIKKKPVR